MEADELKQTLVELRLDYKKFGALMGVTERTVYNWIGGVHRIPTAVVILIDRMRSNR